MENINKRSVKKMALIAVIIATIPAVVYGGIYLAFEFANQGDLHYFSRIFLKAIGLTAAICAVFIPLAFMTVTLRGRKSPLTKE